MKIGLDWDGTVSEDPLVFKKVVEAFLDGGHDVTVVTWRCPPEGENQWVDIEEVFQMWGFRLPTIFCNGKAKRDFYPADIWIDDNPAAIAFSLTRPPRFEADPSAYLADEMVCKREGFPDALLPWGQLRVCA